MHFVARECHHHYFAKRVVDDDVDYDVDYDDDDDYDDVLAQELWKKDR